VNPSTGLSTTYTAPATVSSSQYVTIKAQSNLDATKSATSTIFLSNATPPSLVSFSPNSGSSDSTVTMVFGGISYGSSVDVRFALAPSESVLSQMHCSLRFQGTAGSYMQVNLGGATAYSPGGPYTMALWNGNCGLFSHLVNVSHSGSQLTISFPLSTYFTGSTWPSFVNYSSGWQQVGYWTTY
jgi:hypothetical protein